MRIGKRMKQILEVLKDAEEPLTLTDMIIRIYGLDPLETGFNKLASSIAKQPIGFDTPTPFWIVPKSGKKYHPIEYANLLFSLYSRSLKTLHKHGLVDYADRWRKGNRCRWGIPPTLQTLRN